MPGDVVRLQIWREPDLTGEFPVDERGIAILPKLGAVQVTGRSLAALRDQLRTDYATVLRNPSVDVVPLRRISISGAVHKPGLYTVDPTMSVTDALALAGGISGDGRNDRVTLVRSGASRRVELRETVRVEELAVRSGDQLVAERRSWVSRNPWLLLSAISATTSLIVAVSR